MNLPTIDDVERARERCATAMRRTPLLDDPRLDAAMRCSVYVKAENLQRTGSFKFRGLYNRVAQIDPAARARGVVTMSSGNAAQALAMAARMFGCPCTVVTFPDAAATKLAGARALGARVVAGGTTVDELRAAAQAFVDEHGMVFVHPFDDPQVIAGHGSIALELLEDAGRLDAVLMPTSGGGLLSAASLVVKHRAPDTAVFGVQPAGANGIEQSFRQDDIISVPPRTMADALRADRPGEHNFALIRRHADDILLVDDEGLLPAMKLVWETLRIAIEPGAAVAIAYLLHNDRFEGQRVGVITTGANVDLGLFDTLPAAVTTGV